MTIAQWKTYFDLLQNKYGTEVFSDSDKSLLFNRAIIDYVSSMLPGEGNNVELDADTKAKIAPLIYPISYKNMTSSGVIAKSTIAAALDSVLSGALVWRVLSIGWKIGDNEFPVKFTRDNDWYEFQRNYFKKGYNDSPRYKEDYLNYVFKPINTSAKIYFTVLKYPVEVSIASAINSDLPDFTHNEIIAIALEMAGIASRDVALAELLKAQQ